jgi:hypothetical protein
MHHLSAAPIAAAKAITDAGLGADNSLADGASEGKASGSLVKIVAISR